MHEFYNQNKSFVEILSLIICFVKHNSKTILLRILVVKVAFNGKAAWTQFTVDGRNSHSA